MRVSIGFEPRDLWVGVYWKYHGEVVGYSHLFHLYVCVIPMLPIHFVWEIKHARS